jgi:hypothetical protein
MLHRLKPVSDSLRKLRAPILFLATVGLLLIGFPSLNFTAFQPSLLPVPTLPAATAQPILRTEDVWRQVYEQLPDFPLENQYINKETGEVSSNNTLVSRLMRYHIYTKGRTPAYRLDWKLTLADYLGVNERMSATAYPSADTLRTNPMQGDITAIRALNRVQRDALVQTLVAVFNPNRLPANQPVPQPNAEPESPNPTPPASSPSSETPREPRPGDAQLLIP